MDDELDVPDTEVDPIDVRMTEVYASRPEAPRGFFKRWFGWLVPLFIVRDEADTKREAAKVWCEETRRLCMDAPRSDDERLLEGYLALERRRVFGGLSHEEQQLLIGHLAGSG